ncbi:MAG: IS1595 family transposase [Solirubrobacterales bacterium]
MAKADRNNPKRSKASDSEYSLMEFMADFKDDAACLQWLWMQRFSPDGERAQCPKCEKERKFHKTASRPSWCCDSCGHHIHPTAGTIFHKSSTSLQLWFYAIYLMTSTRCGISAKQLEREIGVGYKTAWRMVNLIRNELMGDDDEKLSGDVEADETLVGGKPKGHPKQRRDQRRKVNRKKELVTVFAAVERSGRVKATIMPGGRHYGLRKQLKEWVERESIVITDEFHAYGGLELHFLDHSLINHTETYVDGDTHTNTIEGFFGNLKTGIRGNYKYVSQKWLQSYLDEFTFRYNHRHDERAMFETLLMRTVS